MVNKVNIEKDEQKPKKSAKGIIIVITLVILIAVGVAGYPLLFKDRDTKLTPSTLGKADKEFTCGKNVIKVFYDEVGNKAVLKNAYVNDIEITDKVNIRENKELADSLDNVDVVCADDYFIIKMDFDDLAAEHFDSFFKIFDYKGIILYEPNSEKDQNIRGEEFVLSTSSDIKVLGDTVTYKLINTINRDNGEIVFDYYGSEGGDLTCDEYNNYKNTLEVIRVYEIEYLGNGKFSDKKLVNSYDLENDFNPETGEAIYYKPENCDNPGVSCNTFKNLTKYDNDNKQLYELCLKSNEDSAENFEYNYKTIYHLSDAKKGFDGATNKEDSDLIEFGKNYVLEMDEHGTIIWPYLNSYGTCFDKKVMKELYNELYSSDTKIKYDGFDNYNYHTIITDNMICFGSPDWGGSEGAELVSDNKSGRNRTLIYEVFGPDEVKIATYTISFKLENGYWKIISKDIRKAD